MTPANSDILFLPFPFGCLLLFSWLIAVARSYSTILSKNGESGYPCLIPGLREKLSASTMEHDVNCHVVISFKHKTLLDNAQIV